MTSKTFTTVHELEPGAKLKDIFENCWPNYKRWFLVDGEHERPSYLDSMQALQLHMPEMVPLYKQLEALFECDDLQSRFLSLYCPPPFASGCSQTIWNREPFALLRNYDYPARLFDGLILCTNWTGTKVIAMSDCVWGVLDGINEHGLAVSLSFGGRNVHGDGFGIAIVLRYILEFCQNTAQAVEVLKRVPIHMDYNIALIDKFGYNATVFVSPDRGVDVTDLLVSANRQSKYEPPLTKSLSDTVIREEFLEHKAYNPYEHLANMMHYFLTRPVYRPMADSDCGTLYTSVYYPAVGAVDFMWPDSTLHLSFEHFVEQEHTTVYC